MSGFKVKEKIFGYCCLLLSLVLCEIIIRIIGFGRLEGKVWLKSDKAQANCYSSNPRGYFPIDLLSTGIGQKDIFSKVFTFDQIQKLQNNFPYCVLYDVNSRLNGTAPELNSSIAIVGDSFAFGEGVKDEDTLAALLGKVMPGYNIKNFGSQGADVLSVYSQIESALQEPEISSIVYIYNLNDILLSDAILQNLNFIIDLQNVFMDSSFEALPSVLRWLRKSALFRSFWVPLVRYSSTSKSLESYDDMYNNEINHKEKEATLNMISKMHSEALKNKKDFYLIIYPLLYKDKEGHYPFADIHKKILDYCKLQGISCYDGANAFSNDPDWNELTVHPSDQHPNEVANKKMVEWIYDSIFKEAKINSSVVQ